MSDTIQHDLFGTLEIDASDEDVLSLSGDVDLGGETETYLRITGSKASSVDEILRVAAEAHRRFVDQRDAVRERAVNDVLSDEWLAEVAENVAEDDEAPEITRAYALDNYGHVMTLAYFTELDEVSILLEDRDGLIGVDVHVTADLAFSSARAEIEG